MENSRAEGEAIFAACPTRTRRYPKEHGVWKEPKARLFSRLVRPGQGDTRKNTECGKSQRRDFGKGMVNYGYSIVGDSKSNIISKNDTIDGDTPDEFSGIE